ncbi:tripartite tricarboxylate transporter substrate binding protein [Cupriavidus taiwanensis]|nr:tripartite tricarboxylate transporter substrate binding protein [Cupriavidus taiwanensis]SOY50554.1 putative extra-cytoplasmic solute receptor [Cupriavidus taiwanensis]SOY50818.1 putative extra-cytoplasmic solute receptor [Cupriavidus taiwanensis]SOY83717.1 putative extra-cytoplasmic solute receptor [Cupriavidus taiwanensis]SOZ23601.1 putative extra-cytoplasmic solute receptor [Cupriavidus taiwanensis]SOZ57934.1 putative extra-cytoplasmic solute receptor [Cupriavidus taiwanensis]
MPRPPDARRRALLKAMPAAALAPAMAAFGLPATVRAQAWPTRPITLIVPFTAGGATDVQMRALCLAASKTLGQPIVIQNQPGVSGTLGPAAMARSAARDGYTLALITPALFRLPHLQPVSYDAIQDFTYIIGLTSYVYGISVPAGSPWQRFGEFVGYARANPGKVNVAAVGTGSLGQITVRRLEQQAGIRLNFIPFKGGADALAALLGGHVDVMIEAGWGAMAEAGKVRLLAVAEPQRLKRWQAVPTLRELGYDITVQSEIGIAGPRALGPAVVATLHDAFRQATSDPAYVRALEAESMPNRYMSTADYQHYAASQFASDKRLVAELGIRLD